MFKWRERDCYVHRDRNNVTPALAGMDLSKEACRDPNQDQSKEVMWFRLEDGTWWPIGIRVKRTAPVAPTMPPQKFKRRLKAKWVGGKKYTLNPEKLRRNLIILCLTILGLSVWGLFWYFWARGMTNPPTM